MTLFIDSSALVKRYLEEPESDEVISAMQADREWIACQVAHSETALTICRATVEGDRDEARMKLDDEWRRFRVLPVDRALLSRAVEIGCEHQVRMLDSIHLAAADRLPRPFTFVTFDRRQASAAGALGFQLGPASW